MINILVDEFGNALLNLAVSQGNLKAVELLLASGAKDEAMSRYTGAQYFQGAWRQVHLMRHLNRYANEKYAHLSQRERAFAVSSAVSLFSSRVDWWLKFQPVYCATADGLSEIIDDIYSALLEYVWYEKKWPEMHGGEYREPSSRLLPEVNAIELSVMNGNESLFRLLLNSTSEEKRHLQALYYTIKYKRLELSKAVLEVSPNIVLNNHGKVIWMLSRASVLTIQYCMRQGITPFEKDSSGCYLLLGLLRWGNFTAVSMILRDSYKSLLDSSAAAVSSETLLQFASKVLHECYNVLQQDTWLSLVKHNTLVAMAELPGVDKEIVQQFNAEIDRSKPSRRASVLVFLYQTLCVALDHKAYRAISVFFTIKAVDLSDLAGWSVLYRCPARPPNPYTGKSVTFGELLKKNQTAALCIQHVWRKRSRSFRHESLQHSESGVQQSVGDELAASACLQ